MTSYPPYPKQINVPMPSRSSDAPASDRAGPPLEGDEGAKWFVAHLKESAEFLFKKQEEIRPMVLILAQRDMETCKLMEGPGIIACAIDGEMMNSDKGKNGFVNWLRTSCHRTEAIGWGFIMEAWTIKAKPGQSADEAYGPYKSLGEHPDRFEIVTIGMQHRALGDETFNYMAEIKRSLKSNGKPRARLGPWSEAARSTGRFAGILAPEAVMKKWLDNVAQIRFMFPQMKKAEMLMRLRRMGEKYDDNDPMKHLLPLMEAKIGEMDIP